MTKRKQDLAAATKKAANSAGEKDSEEVSFVKDKSELGAFLLSLRDRMSDETVAPIFALSAMNQLLIQPDIYTLLTPESKELARDIWLRLKQAGLHVQSPSLLFGADESL